MPGFTGDRSLFHIGNSDFQWGGGFAWLLPIALWSIIWTGLALWHAARRGETGWFLLFLVVHTAGILELIYLLFVIHVFDSKPTVKPRASGKNK